MMTTPTQPSRPVSSAKPIISIVVALVVLVLVVGGIAYVVQGLPRRDVVKPPPPPPPAVEKQASLLEFSNTLNNGLVIAVWEKQTAAATKKEEPPKDKKDDEEKKEVPYLFKEFESGSKGHYDFLFRNVSGKDVEIGLHTSSCDCASVDAAILPVEEWERLKKQREEKPGETLTFTAEPTWQRLAADAKTKPTLVKANEVGIVRARWEARKAAQQELNLRPVVWAQAVGNTARQDFPFFIPGLVTRAVRVFPQRASVGTLPPGTSGKAEFEVWSSTRESLDLALHVGPKDPLFEIDLKPLSKDECVKLAARLNADKEFARENKMPTRALCGYHVTVTVHESRDGKQFEQGAFFRKLPILLDGFPTVDLPGPEVTGRVLGDIVVGGADDHGRIRFRSFDSRVGATRVIDLAAGPKAVLEPFNQHPATLKVELTRDEKNSDGFNSRWKLKVTVPPSTFTGSFSEVDAVTLRVLADPPRFVRIPLEGHVGGR